jgi:hypothetical protein
VKGNAAVRGARLALVVVVLVALGWWVPASPASAADVGDYLALINQLRASRGLGALVLDAEQSALAQQRAEINAANGGLAHTPDLSVGVTANWAKLGENVGLGPSTPVIFDAFVASPAHFANLVDPSFTHVGIGVTYLDGRQYTAHRFLAVSSTPVAAPSPPPPAPSAPTPSVVAPVAAPPAPTTTTTVAAPPPPEPPPAEPARVATVLQALILLAP